MIAYPALLRTYRAVNIYVKKRALTMTRPSRNQGQFLLFPTGMQARPTQSASNESTATALFNDPQKHMDYNQLIKNRENQATVVIDVREPEELASTGIIPGSIHVPLGVIEQALQLTPEEFKKKYGAEKPAKEALIIFSCRGGHRSKDALFKALLHGYENAAHYTGGWLDWERKTKLN